MFKMRVALLGVLALLTVSGIAASAASAAQPAGPYWRVGGTRLGQGEIKQLKLQAKGAFVFKFKRGSVKIEIECKNSYSEGATIIGQGNFQGQDKGRFTYEQCTIREPAECALTTPQIKTSQLKSYLAYNGTKPEIKQQKFVDVFESPQEKFVLLLFKGNCLTKGVVHEIAITGSVAAEVIPIEQEGQEGQLVFPEEPITKIVHEGQVREIGLKFAGEPTVFSGVYGARLVDNQLWGVFGQ
jgi:hypothetical protein